MIASHRSWVLSSLAAFCVVCDGAEAVWLWPVGAPELAARVPCPHCQRQVPISLPPLPDHPRKA